MKQSIFLSLIIAAGLSTGCSNSNEKSSKETIEPKVEVASPVEKPQKLQKLPSKFTPQDFEKQMLLISTSKDEFSPLTKTLVSNIYELRDNPLKADIKLVTDSDGNVIDVIVLRFFDKKDYYDASSARFSIGYLSLEFSVARILDGISGIETSSPKTPANEFMEKVDDITLEAQEYEYENIQIRKFTRIEEDASTVMVGFHLMPAKI